MARRRPGNHPSDRDACPGSSGSAGTGQSRSGRASAAPRSGGGRCLPVMSSTIVCNASIGDVDEIGHRPDPHPRLGPRRPQGCQMFAFDPLQLRRLVAQVGEVAVGPEQRHGPAARDDARSAHWNRLASVQRCSACRPGRTETPAVRHGCSRSGSSGTSAGSDRAVPRWSDKAPLINGLPAVELDPIAARYRWPWTCAPRDLGQPGFEILEQVGKAVKTPRRARR